MSSQAFAFVRTNLHGLKVLSNWLENRERAEREQRENRDRAEIEQRERDS